MSGVASAGFRMNYKLFASQKKSNKSFAILEFETEVDLGHNY